MSARDRARRHGRASEAFASLETFTLLDANMALRDLAAELAQSHLRLAPMHYHSGDARKALAEAPEADLVVASYVINELGDSERAVLADAMWAKTRDTLLVVEPGTPAGYARIIDLRARLIAKGAHVIAPCPHDAAWSADQTRLVPLHTAPATLARA